MKPFDHSPQQQAVIAHLVDPTSGSLIVEARAGSGKTTVILEAAYRATDPTILLCAFNRRIADELTLRITARGKLRGRMIKAQTLHSIGLEIVRQSQPVELDRDATDHLVKEVVPGVAFPIRRAIVKTVRYLKETCDQPVDLAQLIGQLGYTDGIPEPTAAVEVALHTKAVMEASKAVRPTLDFCDMIWRPWAMNLAPRGRYRTVIVDEAQDMSLGQFFLIERLVAPGGRLIVVGDLRQEIYDWRGAAGPKIWNILRDHYKAMVLPLTWSFRCPVNVIREAKAIVPDIDAAPGAPAGTVDTMGFSAAMREIAVGDFFLSRTNAGAVTNAIRAHLRRAQVRVLGGHEVLGPLLDLIKRMDTKSPEGFGKTLGEWFTKECAKENRTQEQADRTEDHYTLLAEAAKLVPPARLSTVLKEVFRDGSEPAALFSTVHKAKGLEAERVFLLKSTFSRHQLKRDGSRKQLADVPFEEQNIEYVGITRAISHLTWVVDDNRPEGFIAPKAHQKVAETVRDHVNSFTVVPYDYDDVTKADVDAGLLLPEEDP